MKKTLSSKSFIKLLTISMWRHWPLNPYNTFNLVNPPLKPHAFWTKIPNFSLVSPVCGPNTFSLPRPPCHKPAQISSRSSQLCVNLLSFPPRSSVAFFNCRLLFLELSSRVRKLFSFLLVAQLKKKSRHMRNMCFDRWFREHTSACKNSLHSSTQKYWVITNEIRCQFTGVDETFFRSSCLFAFAALTNLTRHHHQMILITFNPTLVVAVTAKDETWWSRKTWK